MMTRKFYHCGRLVSTRTLSWWTKTKIYHRCSMSELFHNDAGSTLPMIQKACPKEFLVFSHSSVDVVRSSYSTSCMQGILADNSIDCTKRRFSTSNMISAQEEEETTTTTTDNTDDNDDESISKLWNDMTKETQQLAVSICTANNHNYKIPHTIDTSNIIQGESSMSQNNIKIHPRVAVSRAITLMESKHPLKKKQGDLLLTYLLSISSTMSSSANHKTLRVGFAGPPGAGKSSLLETFGMYLLQHEDPNDFKLGIVCIDPSSTLSGGSILGDKTRMTQLSRQDRAYIRPSSNAGVVGGLSAYTDDVVRLLECAGYPVIFVETVGLGQSEIEVAQSVDVLVLLVPPSGGDELQGVKKGIVEMANILVVTKADGALEGTANRTASDYSAALRVLQHATGKCEDKHNSWVPPVILTSSATKRGLEDLWKTIVDYQEFLKKNGKWEKQRHKQAKYWMWKQFTRMVQIQMKQDPDLSEKANRLESQMLNGLLTPRVAAQELLDGFFDTIQRNK